jgi:RNA polymerase sigma-70 factor (ECF subfamily)
VVKHLEQIRSLESAQSWLATTARRLYWQSLRETSQKNGALQSQIAEPACQLESFETKLERDDWVHHALNQLSPLARIMVMMYFFEAKSYQQIADELEIPMGTVMSRLSRSKEMLRDALLKTAEPLETVKNK